MSAGVTMVEARRRGTLPLDFEGKRSARDVITERLYTCPNGFQLGARRGGRAHLAGACPAHPDGDRTWEVFVLVGGTARGNSVGWATEEQLAVMVDRLANWHGQRCEANRAELVR